MGDWNGIEAGVSVSTAATVAGAVPREAMEVILGKGEGPQVVPLTVRVIDPLRVWWLRFSPVVGDLKAPNTEQQPTALGAGD